MSRLALSRRATVRLFAILCMASTWCGSSSAEEGIRKGDFEIGVDLGWAGFGSDLVDRDGSRFSLFGGYFFTRRLEMEGDITCLGGYEKFQEDANFSICTGSIGAVLNFRGRSRVVPYLRVGAGQAQLTRNAEVGYYNVSDRSGALEIGAGSRVYVGTKGRLAIRLDAMWWRTDLWGEESTDVSVAVGIAYRIASGP